MYLERTYQELKKDFQESLSIQYIEVTQSEPTFLELSGFPDYENVISNIYQFFLEEKHHGLDRLFVSALDDCVHDRDIFLEDYVVKREVYTNKGGRIDIVLEEIDADGNVIKAVLIENKIYHTLENDLTDYQSTYSNVQDLTLIVLSLDEIRVDKEFYNVTHKQLIEKVKSRLGQLLDNANLKFLTLLQDFIQHINRYYEKRIDMDALKYMFENGEKIAQLKLLEQEGIYYIGDEISKILHQTNWKRGRTIPSGLQVQWENKPIYGYFYYEKIFIEKNIKFQIYLKVDDKYSGIKESNNWEQLKELANSKNVKINNSSISKNWHDIAKNEYAIGEEKELENIGQLVYKKLQEDWKEFTERFIKLFIEE